MTDISRLLRNPGSASNMTHMIKVIGKGSMSRGLQVIHADGELIGVFEGIYICYSALRMLIQNLTYKTKK